MSRPAPYRNQREVCSMPTAKEFTLTMDDRPGTLGKICRALSERNVNIIAAQSFPVAGKSTTRFVFDDPTKASININYFYCGADPNTNAPLIIFGVAEIGKATPLLEQAAAAAGRG